eukprot:g4731.t1
MCTIFWSLLTKKDFVLLWEGAYGLFFVVFSGVNSAVTILIFCGILPFGFSWCRRHPLVIALALIAGTTNCMAGVKLLRCRFLGLEAFPFPVTLGCFRDCWESHSCAIWTSLGSFLDLLPLAVYTLGITIVCAIDIHMVRQRAGAEAFFQWVFAIINSLFLICAVSMYIHFHLKTTSHQVADTFMTNEMAPDHEGKITLYTEPTNQLTPQVIGLPLPPSEPDTVIDTPEPAKPMPPLTCHPAAAPASSDGKQSDERQKPGSKEHPQEERLATPDGQRSLSHSQEEGLEILDVTQRNLSHPQETGLVTSDITRRNLSYM